MQSYSESNRIQQIAYIFSQVYGMYLIFPYSQQILLPFK